MTLAYFMDELWGQQNLPVLVYDHHSYDAVWEMVENNIPLDDYGKEYGFAEIAIMPAYAETKAEVYLKGRYANAEVKNFMVTKECMILFIDDEG